MLGKISGQKLRLAKMYIASYCISLEKQSGKIDISHVIKTINSEFKLVETFEINDFTNDITNYYLALKNDKVESIDRGGYWKFKATNAKDALIELTKELNNLKLDESLT